MSSSACSTRPRPTTTSCRRNTPSWPRHWHCSAATSSAPAANASIDDPGQGHLFDLLDIRSRARQRPRPPSPTPRRLQSAPKAARPPRRTSLDHLPHIRIEHDLPEAEKTCSCCGGAKHRIGEDLSRELEFIPAKLEVNVHVLPKYACPKCRDGVASPPVPPKPVPGGIAGAGLVSFVLVSKFADHLPLYRLEDILTRHGVYPVAEHPVRLGPERRRAARRRWPSSRRALVLQSPVLWTDDTPVTVLGGVSPAAPRVGSGPTSATPSTRTASTTSP